MTTTWAAAFLMSGVIDDDADLAQHINGFHGAALSRLLVAELTASGWSFSESFAEDHGWVSESTVQVNGKPVAVSLAASLMDPLPSDPALWRVVMGMDLGLFKSTRTARSAELLRLAHDVETAALRRGATHFLWENGPLQSPNDDGG